VQDITRTSSSQSLALDPELVQRAITKLQNRIIGLEKDRQAQEAFNEKQARPICSVLTVWHHAADVPALMVAQA
jgi:hypothetical protein